MFGFFKKKKKATIVEDELLNHGTKLTKVVFNVDTLVRKEHDAISKEELLFLRKLVYSLPPEYAFLKHQVNSDFLLAKVKNINLGKGYYNLICNPNLYSNYYNLQLTPFDITDILIWSNVKNIFIHVDLNVYEGVLIGFRIDEDYQSLDLERIDISKINKCIFSDEVNDRDQVMNLLGISNIADFPQLDIDDTFKMEVYEGVFYTIKDYKDGNYLLVDMKGAVFLMINDPYIIELIFSTFNEFVLALKKGEFDVEVFYKNKRYYR